MGRIITYDTVVQENLNVIFKEKNVQSGLIIGQCTDQKDIVLRLCPTPKKDDESSSNESATPKKGSSTKSSVQVELDEQWICQHAKQLLRALPGGLDILGLFIVAPFENTVKKQAEFRQVLFAIFKTINKNNELNLCSKDRMLLNICPTTSKITCRTFDISDFKSSAVPADWKLQSGNPKWHRLRCQLAIDIKFPIKSEDAGFSLQKQIESGLHPFVDNVQGAYALVNGAQRDLATPLDATTEGKHSKKRQSSEKDQVQTAWHDIELFLPLETSSASKSDPFDCVCMMTFKGAVQCRAYVHGKASVGEAVKAIKQDIIRSVRARCEIHCEDLLLIDEEHQDPLVVHELPRRVFAPLPQTDVCVCDYQFHSDTASDSLDAFKELLNLDLVEQDIDMSCEVSPTTSTLILPETTDDRLSEFGDAQNNTRMNLFVPIAGVVATFAVGVASYFITASQGS